MILRVLAEARAETIEAAAWYDSKKFGLGDKLLDEIDRALVRIETEPQSFPLWENSDGSDELRRCVLRRFPYVVIFICRPEETIVVAVSHGRRLPYYWRERLS